MRMLISRWLLCALLSLVALPAQAQTSWTTPGGSTVNGAIGLCLTATNKAVPCSDPSALASPVSGSFSATLTGFTPGGTFATLTATNASASVALPVGATVAFQNTGTTTVSCTLGVGAATATISQIQVPASSTVFVTPGSNTFGACIDQTGSVSNLVVLAGGSGLGTGFGGGGGGSGGGGVVTQPTAANLNALVAQGAAGGAAWLVTGTGGTFPVTGTFWPYTLGQQLAANSVPVILPAATITTLTPPTTITANQGGAPWSQNTTQWNSVALGSPSVYGTSPGAVNVPGVNAFVTNALAAGQAAMAASSPVVIASNQSSIPVAATLNAETTKIIGTIRMQGNVGGVLDAIGQNVAAPANWLQSGCQFNTAPTTITTGNGSPCQMDNAGRILINTGPLGSGVQAAAPRFTLATDSPGIVTLGATTKSASVPMVPPTDIGTTPIGSLSSQYPSNSTAAAVPITASATGTTAATTATLAGVASKTTYLCGFSIRANATAAATGNATVTGTITGTLNFTQWTAPLASGIGTTEPNIGSACIPASAANTGIAVISAAPGAGGVVSVTAWGYQL